MGKHVYGEKPLAADRAEADSVLAAARAGGLRVGCAPDTVLGTGTQTARKAVDELYRDGAWEPLPVKAGYPDGGRGTGLAGLADALAADRPHRASAELAGHVLDVMLTLLDSAREGTRLPIGSTCERPAPVDIQAPAP